MPRLAAIRAGAGSWHLSPERIWSELSRILAVPDPRATVALMAELGVRMQWCEGADAARTEPAWSRLARPLIRCSVCHRAADPARVGTRAGHRGWVVRVGTRPLRHSGRAGPLTDSNDAASTAALADEDSNRC